MFVSFSTKVFGSIGSFTSGANGCFRTKVLLDCEGLPLHHTQSQGFVHKVSIFIRTGIVHGDTNIGSRPGRVGMSVANSTHISRFKVLFTFEAHR